MRNPTDISETDDLKLEQPDEHWIAGGEMELAEERPTTALRGDPSQRKWMMGVGACALLAAVAVLVLANDGKSSQAGEVEQQAVAIEQPVVEDAPVVEAAPVLEQAPEPKRERPTLAARTHAAASSPAVINKAPPAPASGTADPQPSEQPSAQPSKPSA